MTFYEMLKDNPKFKRFSARHTTRPHDKKKPFKVPIPTRKGMLSVLGPYTTGKAINIVGGAAIKEILSMKKINGEFVSQSPDPNVVGMPQEYDWPWGKMGDKENKIDALLTALEEQNKLLRELAA